MRFAEAPFADRHGRGGAAGARCRAARRAWPAAGPDRRSVAAGDPLGEQQSSPPRADSRRDRVPQRLAHGGGLGRWHRRRAERRSSGAGSRWNCCSATRAAATRPSAFAAASGLRSPRGRQRPAAAGRSAARAGAAAARTAPARRTEPGTAASAAERRTAPLRASDPGVGGGRARARQGAGQRGFAVEQAGQRGELGARRRQVAARQPQAVASELASAARAQVALRPIVAAEHDPARPARRSPAAEGACDPVVASGVSRSPGAVGDSAAGRARVSRTSIAATPVR